jgi:hypothetical protein
MAGLGGADAAIMGCYERRCIVLRSPLMEGTRRSYEEQTLKKGENKREA